MYFENVLATIGNTPLIKLSRVCKDIPGTILGKVEAFNPGNSAKDRIALYMVEEAERKGKLKPGSTIVEATSGNTGFSLAMVCALKGYKCVLTVSSKSSKEKISLLRALGAEVVICPVDVEPDDPASYYMRAEQIARDTPNSYYLGQNWNQDNSNAHYHTTGPEIWKQTEGKVTHYVCCVGTGGTLSGTARYLKEQNPNIKIIGVDAYGSVLKKYWETGVLDKSEIASWKVEGLGKTIIPDNVDFQLIDEFIKVTDRSSAHRARQLARLEGLLMGYSSGSALQAVFQMKKQLKPDDVVVVMFPDHGSRYVGKIYDDDWMRQQGFMGVHHPTSQYDSFKRLYKKYVHKYKRYIRQTLSI
ncbi:MAG: PLP-dependent cysteine synthase family protein [Saprospiraceae bacterium]